MLGHADIATTQIYTHVADRPAAQAGGDAPTRWPAANDPSLSRFRAADRRARRQDRRAAPSFDRPASSTSPTRSAASRASANRLLRQTYARLTPWQKVQVARHPERPHCLDYIGGLITDFVPLAGDRAFAEDAAIDRRHRPLSRAQRSRARHREGRRHRGAAQAQFRHGAAGRVSQGAAADAARRALRPAGADLCRHRRRLSRASMPRRAARAEAIARAIETCLDIKVPLVAAIIGEGGSGGAIALAAGNTVLMLEHAIYSVISPEGCASILWRERRARARMRRKRCGSPPQDLQRLGDRRPDRARAARRRAARPEGGRRAARRGDRRGAAAAARPRWEHPAPAAPRKISRDGRPRPLTAAIIDRSLGLPTSNAARRLRRRRCSSSEDTAFPASEGIHDPPGKRAAHDPARPPEKCAAASQGSRGRCADPSGDGRAAGSALLPRADRADPGSEPASGAAADRRSREAARRCPASGEADAWGASSAACSGAGRRPRRAAQPRPALPRPVHGRAHRKSLQPRRRSLTDSPVMRRSPATANSRWAAGG